MSRHPSQTRDKKLEAYRAQRDNARARGIRWRFTYEEWCTWWGNDYANRGRKNGQLMMARRGDKGAYAPSNVYKATPQQNRADADPRKQAMGLHLYNVRRRAAGIPHHFDGMRGDLHPCSRAVLTPLGRFGSLRLAGEAHKISEATVRTRIKTRAPGWRFELNQIL